MRIQDVLKVELEKALVELHGHCRLEICEGDKVVDSLEFDNNVTPLIYNSINRGNFYNQIPTSAMLPLIKWLLGVVLIDKNGDPATMSIPSDANIIACANNASGSDSTDLRRGNFNQESSSVILGADNRVIGYKFVWYWSDTRGNTGEDQYIKAVCLTRPGLALSRYGDELPPDTNLSEVLNTFTVSEALASCQIIDYGGETAYNVSISSGNVVVKKYQLDTKQFHIFGLYNSSNVFDVTKLIAEETLTPTIAIARPTDYTKMSISFIGGKLHLITWNGQTVLDHEIDVSDDDSTEWTITTTSHTFVLGTGVNVKDAAHYHTHVSKDIVLYSYDSDNDKFYLILVGSDNKFYSCDLSNDANITQLTGATLANSNGVFISLSNGDWIKYSWGQDNVTFLSVNYFHNGKVYLGREAYNAPAGWGCKYRAVNNTGYGTVLYSMPHNGRYGNDHYMALGIPCGSISTVWNINDDDHYKLAGMTMRVIYEVREQII